MSALARIEAREAAEAACQACADTGHVEGYAGRAEHCPCMGHLRAVVDDLQRFGSLARETIRRVCQAVDAVGAEGSPL